MAMQKFTIGTVLAVAVMGMIASSLGVLIATRTFSNTGNLKAIGVDIYTDSGCTNKVTSIDWGALVPGSTKNFTMYVRNEGTVSVKLSMTTSNWNPPSASSYITLSWNRENQVLTSGSVVSAVLTLSISSSITGITSFSFDITITGTETS